MMGIISDIHGNFEALKVVMQYFDNNGIKDIVCLGDVAGYYSQINEWCDLLRSRDITCIMGNHDWYMTGESFCPRSKSVNDCLKYQRSIITEGNKKWISSLSIFYKKDQISMVHGGWSDPIDEYLQPEPNYFKGMPNMYYFSGHTHVQRLLRWEDKLYCNPGSIGQPRDGDNKAAFAVWDNGVIELKRVTYDFYKVGQLMEQAGFNGYFYECLYVGGKTLGYYK